MRSTLQRPKRLDPGLSRGGLTEPSSLGPFGLVPQLKEKVWGGDRLSPGRPVGEAWLVADLDEGQTTTSTGQTLGALLDAHGAALSGARTDRGRFPLLVKTIDAARDLSVQVHPDAQAAARFEGAHSKDEAWLVTHAAPGAAVLLGFLPGTTRAQFEAALADKRPERCLQRLAVRPGDVLRIAPGTIHAICAGVTLLEVQEPSDTTFRVWDYDRPGLDGRPRPLHVDQALACLQFSAPPAPTVPQRLGDINGATHDLLVDAPRYRIERLAPVTDVRLAFPDDRAVVVVALDADITLGTAGHPDLDIAAGEAAIVPQCIPQCHLIGERASVVLASVGGGPIAGAGS